MNSNAGKSVPQQGFSIIELMAVLTIIALLGAMALPSYMSWRRNIEYRTVARDIVSTLRDARSKSIATNRNYQVQFDGTNRQYRTRVGLRPRNTNWAAVDPAIAWTAIPTGVNITSDVDISVDPANPAMGVIFNPDGTVLSNATVTVLDSTLNPKIAIDIIPSGKIKTR